MVTTKEGVLCCMIIKYKNKSAEQQFSSKYQKKWRYPEIVKEKLKATENFIEQATSLHDIVMFLPFHFHRLKGDRKGEWSIYLGKTGYRVTLIPCDDEKQEILSGDIIAQCKTIKIVTVTEVSNHYE